MKSLISFLLSALLWYVHHSHNICSKYYMSPFHFSILPISLILLNKFPVMKIEMYYSVAEINPFLALHY